MNAPDQEIGRAVSQAVRIIELLPVYMLLSFGAGAVLGWIGAQ